MMFQNGFWSHSVPPQSRQGDQPGPWPGGQGPRRRNRRNRRNRAAPGRQPGSHRDAPGEAGDSAGAVRDGRGEPGEPGARVLFRSRRDAHHQRRAHPARGADDQLKYRGDQRDPHHGGHFRAPVLVADSATTFGQSFQIIVKPAS